MAHAGVPVQVPMVHVRFEGRSWDLALHTFDLGADSSDQALRQALAHYFEVPVAKFAAYIVERHTNGNLTVRPEAVFG